MDPVGVPGALATLLTVLLALTSQAGAYPRAQNVTWTSTNFKTILTWEPRPSSEYSYTVEFSAIGRNKQRNTNCIQTSATMCDLSRSLTDLKACYTADVLSDNPLGITSDLIEFPSTSSPRFCPYKDTAIGRPNFKLKVNDNKRITLHVMDPPTALFKDGRQLNIRDIFTNELQYKVTYRRNKSTGKKVLMSETSVIELSDLDRGESYCFQVQAFIQGRSYEHQLGELSPPQCSSDEQQSVFEVYSLGVIAAAIVLILLLIGIIVAVAAVGYSCHQRSNAADKEAVGLRQV